MIEKRAEYFSSDFDYPIFSLLEKGNEKELTKTASYDGPVSEYLGSLKREKGYLYALVNALTAGEYYGPNRNGDFFPEEALKKHHKTFEEFGHVYKHHINKDPRKSMGKVLFSHYNPKMRRVEVVVRLKKSHPDVQNLQEGISKGMLPKVSMGCRVPYDVCSITGKKARTRDEYSEYLLHQMGKILPDGRRVCAINTRPKFFDVSIVVIPADPVAAFMATFDEEGGYLKQAEQFIVSEEPKGLTKVATLIDEKTSQITKEVSGDFENIQEDPSDLIKNTTPRFTQDEIEKLSAYPLNEVLSTFAALRIFPHREDFQKIALYSIGEKDLANELEKKGTYFSNPKTAVELSDLGISHMKEKIANELIGSISKYSLTKPFIINRIVEKSASLNDIVAPILPNKKEVERSFIKKLIMDGEPEPATSGVKNPLAAFTTLGTLYAGFALLYGKTANSSEFVKMVSKHPWIAPGMGAGLAMGVTKLQENILKDQPLNKEAAAIGPMTSSFLIGVPLSYYMSAKNELKARKGQGLSNTENFIRKNPLISGITGSLASGFLLKGMNKSVGKLSTKMKKYPNKPTGFFGKEAGLYPETLNLIFKEITTS